MQPIQTGKNIAVFCKSTRGESVEVNTLAETVLIEIRDLALNNTAWSSQLMFKTHLTLQTGLET